MHALKNHVHVLIEGLFREEARSKHFVPKNLVRPKPQAAPVCSPDSAGGSSGSFKDLCFRLPGCVQQYQVSVEQTSNSVGAHRFSAAIKYHDKRELWHDPLQRPAYSIVLLMIMAILSSNKVLAHSCPMKRCPFRAPPVHARLVMDDRVRSHA